jgi:hypothetical protein
MEDLKELRKEADELGITYSGNTGVNKLKEKIEAFYVAKEAEDEPEVLLEGGELFEAQESIVKVKKRSMRERAKIAEKAARVLHTVEITDNDPSQNTHTTTCEPSCGNQYFDLGTFVCPLNIPVAVMQGHLNVLKEMMLPHHLVDHATGLSKATTRNRYTISYVR